MCYKCHIYCHAECNVRNGQIVRPAKIVQQDRFCCAQCEDYNPHRSAITEATSAAAPEAVVAAVDDAADLAVPLAGFLGFSAKDVQQRSQRTLEQTVGIVEPAAPEPSEPAESETAASPPHSSTENNIDTDPERSSQPSTPVMVIVEHEETTDKVIEYAHIFQITCILYNL